MRLPLYVNKDKVELLLEILREAKPNYPGNTDLQLLLIRLEDLEEEFIQRDEETLSKLEFENR